MDFSKYMVEMGFTIAMVSGAVGFVVKSFINNLSNKNQEEHKSKLANSNKVWEERKNLYLELLRVLSNIEKDVNSIEITYNHWFDFEFGTDVNEQNQGNYGERVINDITGYFENGEWKNNFHELEKQYDSPKYYLFASGEVNHKLRDLKDVFIRFRKYVLELETILEADEFQELHRLNEEGFDDLINEFKYRKEQLLEAMKNDMNIKNAG